MMNIHKKGFVPLLMGLVLVFVIVVAFILFLLPQGEVVSYETDLWIHMSRGPCFGTCPVYTLDIYGNGTVIYNGSNFTAKGISVVRMSGIHTHAIRGDELDLLVDAFNEIGYFDLENEYTTRSYSDGQTVTTSIRFDGQEKTITHYHGDANAPATLTTLEDRIDTIVGTERWI